MLNVFLHNTWTYSFHGRLILFIYRFSTNITWLGNTKCRPGLFSNLIKQVTPDSDNFAMIKFCNIVYIVKIYDPVLEHDWLFHNWTVCKMFYRHSQT